MTKTIISIENLNKIYAGGFCALKDVSLDINSGEILALLGPNGAGKTTLISILCGIVNPSSGKVTIDGHDLVKDYKKARSVIGLVPQELTTDAFETVWNTVSFSRGLFGKPKNPKIIEEILKDLHLWDKKDNRLMSLSGGMKRRVLIAKALSHEPRVLFLDEPTAGVDVELRKSMWEVVRKLRQKGVTIILTTHYIEEAQEMADRVGVMRNGELILTENKDTLMQKLGAKRLTFELVNEVSEVPSSLSKYHLRLEKNGGQLIYTYDSNEEENQIAKLLSDMEKEELKFKDLYTKQSSLEEIFINLVHTS